MSNDVTRHIRNCTICSEEKPRFFRPPQGHIINATRPWEKISVDFVGPKKSSTANHYLFVVIDEFSRFPFAFPIPRITTEVAIDVLSRLFSLFGPCESVHSDRGTQFESAAFRDFLSSHGVKKTRTTPYNPAANGQCERMNAIIWKTISLRLRELNRPIEDWESQLSQALHNIRTLVCRTSGESPHSRFFCFNRRSALSLPRAPCVHLPLSQSFPSWLCDNSPALYKKNVR